MVGAIHVAEFVLHQRRVQTLRRHVVVLERAGRVPSGEIRVLLIDQKHEVAVGRQVDTLRLLDHRHHLGAGAESQGVPFGTGQRHFEPVEDAEFEVLALPRLRGQITGYVAGHLMHLVARQRRHAGFVPAFQQ